MPWAVTKHMSAIISPFAKYILPNNGAIFVVFAWLLANLVQHARFSALRSVLNQFFHDKKTWKHLAKHAQEGIARRFGSYNWET